MTPMTPMTPLTPMPPPPQNVPPDLAVCCFVLEQSLSVRALQEMLANCAESGGEVRGQRSRGRGSKVTGAGRGGTTCRVGVQSREWGEGE